MPELAAGVTISQTLALAAADLHAAGLDTPRLDAELLLAHALGVDRARLVLDAREPIEQGAAARFEALLERRRSCEPVAYILGRRAFRRLELSVDPRVLIPRPETELLVEAGLSLPPGARVLDVGTGSGAVALALADERPDLEVWGSDASAEALEVARANAARLGLPVSFVQADLLEGVPGPFDAVLANLPYVADGEQLPADVAGFEPRLALYGGPDGLVLMRRLAGQLGAVPFAALEVGLGQAAAVAWLLRGAGLHQVELARDLAGIERVVVGRRA
ncbi:MAG TPA: peptide chain release factor N(5)-glutamine methyltransferase [Solirubrobacteraceae bacterium]|nr:peptide chain release factor N(5)-glutamine methyltransferase [Solirubrobacteraceae bacterium]